MFWPQQEVELTGRDVEEELRNMLGWEQHGVWNKCRVAFFDRARQKQRRGKHVCKEAPEPGRSSEIGVESRNVKVRQEDLICTL